MGYATSVVEHCARWSAGGLDMHDICCADILGFWGTGSATAWRRVKTNGIEYSFGFFMNAEQSDGNYI
jgi:hypothetical protein